MIISSNRMPVVQSVEIPRVQKLQDVTSSLKAPETESQTPPADPGRVVEKDTYTLMTRERLRGLDPNLAILMQTSPTISSPILTAELPAMVTANEQVLTGNGSSQPGGQLGTETTDTHGLGGPLEDEPEGQLPELGASGPGQGIHIPGGEDSWSWGSAIEACVAGAIAGGKLGGPTGAAAGCAVGAAAGFGHELAGDAIDKIIDIITGPPGDDLTPVPMGTPKDMGVPVSPQSDPNPDADPQGGYTPKFGLPSLGWLDPLKPRPSEGDPIGVEKNEPSDVLRIFDPAVDPNPDADKDQGGVLRTLLSTSGAVTDPIPDAGLRS